jgi:transketolase
MATLNRLINAKAIAIAKLAVRATTTAGSGYPTSALSLAHLIATLMYHTMRWRPEQLRDATFSCVGRHAWGPMQRRGDRS